MEIIKEILDPQKEKQKKQSKQILAEVQMLEINEYDTK
jgi:hypothetical protein